MAVINYEYVMSGVGFTRLTTHEPIDYVHQKFAKDFGGRHDFAVLYNAYTEKEYGRRFSPSTANLYADSGGLQMVTRAVEIDSALKDKIYIHQGEHSDFAMCFDEIPMVKVDDTGKIGSQSGRYYDRRLIKAKATETAENILRQIEIFKNQDSTAKPVAIIQGNCADTMLEWADVLFGALGKDLKEIGSIAISGVCIGNKTMEEIERAFVFSQIHNRFGMDHLHLLGVGSVSRIAPFLMFDKTFTKDLLISYDSTSHTQATTFGYHFWSTRLDKLKKGFDKQEWSAIAERVRVFSDGDVDLTAERLYELAYMSVRGIDEGTSALIRKTLFYVAAVQAWYLAKYIEATCRDFEGSLVHHDPHLHLPFRHLNEDVRSVEDFKRWSAEFGRFIPTSRVNSSHSSLMGLFG